MSNLKNLRIGAFVGALSLLFPQFLCAQSLFDSTRVTHRLEVYFTSGKADLSPEALVVIDSFSKFYQKNPERVAQVRITAHTDSVGNPAANQTLSQRRADAVRGALVKNGVPAQRINETCFGERTPAAANSTEEGRQRNRRATLDALLLVPMVPYVGQVKDKTTGEGIPATVFFNTKTRKDSVETDSVGHFAVRLPKDSVVRVETVAQGYFFATQMVKLNGSPEMLKKMREQPVEIALPSAKPGDKLAISNLYFVGNQAVLLKSSEPELPKVLRFLQANPTLRVELGGHINAPGRSLSKMEDWEIKLSEGRARTVYNYLVEHGIPASRLEVKGYHNTQMLFPNPTTPAQQEQNRRVEIKVLE